MLRRLIQSVFLLCMMFPSTVLFYSPPASALISIICMENPETGIITCTAQDEGGGSCADDGSCYGSGGGTGCGGACGDGGSNSASQEQVKIVVERYKHQCRPANQSAEVYSASQIESCKTASYSEGLREYPALRYLPGGTAGLGGIIAPLRNAHVADQIVSGNDKACP